MRATRTSVLVGGVIAAILASLGAPHAQPKAAQPGLGLTVPPGFAVEQVAGPPLVNRPIVADFDDEGRLYVADSSGSNDKVDKQLVDRPHRIVRLEDTDGDGRFDSSIVFADRMMFPEGAMWLDGSLYVAAPPSIWKLTDTDGDGIADQREEWFQGKTLTGCANDLHGPYLGPDGWIYWTKGAFAEQTYERPGKPPLVTRASHIFRRRPGDQAIDVVLTGGMDNPVDVAFTASGERILSATFLKHPEVGLRDGLVHAVYGGVYGKPHAVIDGHKRTGDLMPVMDQLGPAVPAGLTRYMSRVFGDGFRDNFFAAMFNLRKVTRHVLEPSGATFTMRDSDFLASDNRDFHPTDVLEDADGSLLVIDTGPWYKLCCPTSQLAKPEVLGGIYRVRRLGAPTVRDPRGRALAWSTMQPADMATLLSDRRPAVQNRAVSQLAKRGEPSIPAMSAVLRRSTSPDARRNAVWALTRIEGALARAAVRIALDDQDESVRHAALHSVSVWRDGGASSQVTVALKSGKPAVQRAAAEALGRIGDVSAVADLIAAAASPVDRVLEHSIIYALIEINDPRSTAASGRQAMTSQSRRAALIALDQMDDGKLTSDRVIALLNSPDPVLRDTAWWIAGHHPEWGNALASFFQEHLTAAGASAEDRPDLQQKLAQFGENPAIQELLAGTIGRAGSKEDRLTALRAMAVVGRTRVKVLPSGWIAPLVLVLESQDDDVTTHALAVVRAAPAPKDASDGLGAALLRVGQDHARSAAIRLDALASIADGVNVVDPETFELLRSGLEPSRPASIRSAAAAVIEKARLDPAQLTTMAASLQTAGPLDLPRILRAYGKGSDEAAGLAMIAALRQAKGRSSVRADVLGPLLASYPESVHREGQALLASLSLDSDKQVRRLEELLRTVQGGDVGRGQAVFNSPKAACYSCHAIGYMGGRIGPDLTRIGQVRGERDLLEAITFPSASFARGYEPVTIRTRSGEVRSGVLRSDLADEVVLVTGERDETRILRRDIVDIQPGTVSLMPQGLAEQLTQQELADLLAFLKATRSGAN
jgi:putative membrane-bound dehydrogenase-like protein